MSLATACRAPALGDVELSYLMDHLQDRAGIRVDSTSGVIAGHVRERMNYLGLGDISDYLQALADIRAEWVALADLLTVKETRFFRQPEAFDCLARYLRQYLAAGERDGLSFWSAGCATGQELYSMAMVVAEAAKLRDGACDWHGIGTDFSFKAIRHARAGVYSETAAEAIPWHLRERYTAVKLGGRRKISTQILQHTDCVHSNLLHSNSAPNTEFDVIFCQNVLIYFERGRQRWIIDQLVDRLRPGGLLVLGAGEDAAWSNAFMRRAGWPGVCAYIRTGV